MIIKVYISKKRKNYDEKNVDRFQSKKRNKNSNS